MAGNEIRLDKYLADMKVGTRSEVRIYIRKSRVRVNGEIVRDIGYKVSPEDRVSFDDKDISYVEKEYIMLNKPAGVLTATTDRHQSTVLDLIADSRRKDLAPVGRLDKDTEGLLLLTNDGALAHRLLSPRHHVDKVYYARVRGKVTEKEAQLFAEGLVVDEEFTALPAALKILKSADESEIELTIREGKYHQVKRMFEAVGMEVLYLKRLSMGSLHLDPRLAPGESRPLTQEEVLSLTKHAAEQNPEEGCALLDGIRAVIFDLDGTLVDSMWLWRAIDIEYLGRFGITLPENLQACIEGMSFTETAVYFKENFPAITDSLEQMKAEWNRMAWDKYAHEVTLKPGVLEFLKVMRSRGLKTGIATSNSVELVDTALTHLHVREYFDEVHTACEVKAGKPAPDIYLLVAKKLGVEPEHCLVFEDICKGIQAGKAAGMRVCAVRDAYSADAEKEKIRLSDGFIESYLELLV